MVVAVVVFVGGLAFGLGRLTTPSTEATPETTTKTTTVSLETPTTQLDDATWTVERIATTEQFHWQQAETIETWPVGLFATGQGSRICIEHELEYAQLRSGREDSDLVPNRAYVPAGIARLG